MEILLAILIGFGGGWYIAPAQKIECTDKALVIASCPPLIPLTDPSFGGHILQLQKDSGQYKECRKACLDVRAVP